MKKFLIICMGIFCLAQNTHANEPNYLVQAKQLLQTGQSQQAYALLSGQSDQNGNDPQAWFLLGMSASQTNNFSQAEQAFRKVLDIDPAAGRVKLELAQVLFRQGRIDEAKVFLAQARADNPPQNVRAKIDNILTGIERGRRPVWDVPADPNVSGWEVHTSVGVQYDTNINAGPDIDTIFIYGLPFALSDDAKGQEDWTGLVRVGAQHQGAVGKTRWESSLFLNGAKNKRADALDNLYLTGSTGPSFRLNQRLTLSAPVTGDIVKYGVGKNWYSHSAGFAPRLSYALKENMWLNFGARVNQKIFKQNRDRDSLSLSGSVGAIFKATERDLLRLHVTAGQETSDLKPFSNDVLSLGASYSRQINDSVGLDLQTSFNASKFDEAQAGYAAARDDEAWNAGVNLTKKIREDISFTVSGSYTKNKSNLDLFDYDRQRFSFRMNKVY